MPVRRTSRRVALTAAFLTLAAGGAAACDDATGPDDTATYHGDGFVPANPAGAAAAVPTPATTSPTPPSPTPPSPTPKASSARVPAPRKPTTQAPPPPSPPAPVAAVAPETEPGDDDVFYCADEQGTVVDEWNCDADVPGAPYFLYYSAAFVGDYPVGSTLPPGGSRFPHHDQVARQRYGLPTGGVVPNGSIKTNIVGGGGSGFNGGTGSAGG